MPFKTLLNCKIRMARGNLSYLWSPQARNGMVTGVRSETIGLFCF
jgi:hypothetical protein